MKKSLIVICMFLTSLSGVFRISPLLAEQYDYQNYNHGYYPTCERCHRNPCECQNRPGVGAINAPPRPPGTCPPGYNCNGGDSSYTYPAQPSCGTPMYTSPVGNPCGTPACSAPINTCAPCGQECEEPADPPATTTEKTCEPCANPEAACKAPCAAPCGDTAPACGADCGISICALGIGLAALAAAAAIIVSSGNGSSSH